MNAIPEDEEVSVSSGASFPQQQHRLPPPPPPPAFGRGSDGGGQRRPGNWREQLRPPDESPLESTSTTGSSSSGPQLSKAATTDQDEDGYESDWEKEISVEGSVFFVAPYSEDELRQEREREQAISALPQEAKEERKTKKMGKLSRLVRRRESKRDRINAAGTGAGARPKFGGKVSGAAAAAAALRSPQSPGESSDNDSSTYYGQLRTFESVIESATANSIAEMQEVTIRIKGRKSVVDGGGSLLEQMMGIVPMRHHDEDSDNVVVVAGYLTDGPAIKISDKLQIGDIIRLVDGQQVNLTIIEQLLSTFSSSTKIKITIQRPPAKLFPDPLSSSLEHSGSSGDDTVAPSLIKMLTGDGPTAVEVQSILKKLPYIVLYLTRSGITESSPELADVLYQYPTAVSGSHSIKLLKVRGVFVTLCQALPEILGSTPVTTSISVDDELVHVGFAQEGEDHFLIALSDVKCNASEVETLTRDVSRVLRLQFGSLPAAFSGRNHAELNKFFNVVLLDELLGISGSVMPPSLDVASVLAPSPPKLESRLPGTQWLNLPDDIKFQVDDAMNQFESADFQDYSEDFYDLPREFNILGSCVFHKGFLLASHLRTEDMTDVTLWCSFYKLLGLTRSSPVHQVVSWNEVFLSRTRKGNETRGEYESAPGRTFLLVVGLGHQLLGTLLQTGGCAANPKGRVRPDPFYVDQAMNTLDHLDEMGIPVVCDCWLRLPPNPDIINVDQLYEVAVSAKRLDAMALSNASASSKQLPEKGIILQRTKSIDYSSASSHTESEEVASLHQSENSEVSEDAAPHSHLTKDGMSKASDLAESNSSVWDLHRSDQRSRNNYSENLREDASPDEYVTYQVCQLSISPENTVFHFLHLDSGEAVFLAPLSAPSSPLHAQLLHNFRAACQIMHNNFDSSRRVRRSELAVRHGQVEGASSQRGWSGKSSAPPSPLLEQGMLFQWSPKVEDKTLPLLSYWICGRLFESVGNATNECYVCYHESAPQVMVELAFKLMHGVHL